MPAGIVKEKKRDLAIVIMQRTEMCGACHACEMLSGKKACTLTCKDDIGAKVGEQVEVTLGTEYFLKATYIMYGMPLIGFVLGLGAGWVGTRWIPTSLTDLWLVVGALLGTGLGIFYIKRRDKKKAYQKYMPHIISKIEIKR